MTRSLKYLICFLLLIITAASAQAAWYTSSEATKAWLYRQKITVNSASIDAGAATYTNFPVLVEIKGTSNSIFSKAQSTGQDILFTSSNELTKLNHDLDYYNAATGTFDAWVTIPSLPSGANTTLYMYYGCANATTQESKAAWSARPGARSPIACCIISSLVA